MSVRLRNLTTVADSERNVKKTKHRSTQRLFLHVLTWRCIRTFFAKRSCERTGAITRPGSTAFGGCSPIVAKWFQVCFAIGSGELCGTGASPLSIVFLGGPTVVTYWLQISKKKEKKKDVEIFRLIFFLQLNQNEADLVASCTPDSPLCKSELYNYFPTHLVLQY